MAASAYGECEGQVQVYFPASKGQARISAYLLKYFLTKHIGKSEYCSGTRGTWRLAEWAFTVHLPEKCKCKVPPNLICCQTSRPFLRLCVSKRALERPSRAYFLVDIQVSVCQKIPDQVHLKSTFEGKNHRVAYILCAAKVKRSGINPKKVRANTLEEYYAWRPLVQIHVPYEQTDSCNFALFPHNLCLLHPSLASWEYLKTSYDGMQGWPSPIWATCLWPQAPFLAPLWVQRCSYSATYIYDQLCTGPVAAGARCAYQVSTL